MAHITESRIPATSSLEENMATEAIHAAIDSLFRGREQEIRYRITDLEANIWESIEYASSLQDDIDNESNDSIRQLLEGQLAWVKEDRDEWLRECEELQEELNDLERKDNEQKEKESCQKG
ncbi:hypothetical protein M434DRAFT_16141 [Hypoxylon sp. CO27-5]|nr:hypothetical protein M434DRAFT_16141 [Hypoxylon sp. CO27-5]